MVGSHEVVGTLSTHKHTWGSPGGIPKPGTRLVMLRTAQRACLAESPKPSAGRRTKVPCGVFLSGNLAGIGTPAKNTFFAWNPKKAKNKKGKSFWGRKQKEVPIPTSNPTSTSKCTEPCGKTKNRPALGQTSSQPFGQNKSTWVCLCQALRETKTKGGRGYFEAHPL